MAEEGGSDSISYVILNWNLEFVGYWRRARNNTSELA